MPTAAEYDAWAGQLGTIADEMTGLTASAAAMASPEAIMGGMVAVTVDLAVRAAQANSLTAAARLRELADECERRAVICAEYDAAMDEYERRCRAHRTAMDTYGGLVEEAMATGGYIGSPPSAPVQPTKPHSWVER